jgi:hypothetical protein
MMIDESRETVTAARNRKRVDWLLIFFFVFSALQRAPTGNFHPRKPHER